MKRSFVLITRSYKYGGSCVAGFDTATKRWIRLVSSFDPTDNEIERSVFAPFDDLDILEVETVGEAPCGCQTENAVLDPSVPPRRVGKLSFSELLAPGYVSSSPAIFGNFLSELSEEEIVHRKTSLGLFEVRSLFFDFRLGDDGKRHYRCKFTYRGKQYAELSLTDPVYRKDSFAGKSIGRALLAVSLPAIPYSNGKYYKFIAKIFPLSEEDGALLERNFSAFSAPHPHNFAQDRPNSSTESRTRAVHFLRSLAEGRDPDTNAALDPASVLSPSYAAWFRYCAAEMEKFPPRGEERAIEEKRTYILRENIGRVGLSDEPVTASRLSERINAVREPYGKNMTAVAVSAFFFRAGLTEEKAAAHKYKVPTELGRQYGVSSEMRLSKSGFRYVAVLYGRAAQQFFLDNLEQCAEVLEAPLLGSAAEIEQGAWTREGVGTTARPREDVGASEPSRELGRTAAFARELPAEPEADGRDRSWEQWDKQEQEALVREYGSGLRLEEIAKLHRRSVVAITVRLKMLNIKV